MVCLLGITLHFVVFLVELWQPRHLIDIVPDPNVDSLVESLSCAISGKIDSTDPFEFHRRVSQMYSWQRVAGETVTVYDRVIARPRLSLSQRLVRYKTVRHLAGFVV